MVFIFIGNVVPSKNIYSVINLNPKLNLSIADNEYSCAYINSLSKIGRVINVSIKVKDKDKKINLLEKYQFNKKIITYAIFLKNSNFILNRIERIFRYWQILEKIIKDLDGEDIIITHLSGQIIYMLPAVLSKLKYKTKHVVFTGLVYLNHDFLTIIYSSLSVLLINFVDAVITFSPLFAKRSLKNIPYVLHSLPVLDSTIENYKKYREKNQFYLNKKFTIVFSGSLNEYAGGNLIYDLIRETKGKYRWLVCGSGSFSDKISSLSKQKKYDLTFLGLLTKEEVIKLQTRADLLINLRPINSRRMKYSTDYNPSSKINEYILSGKPVLTTDAQSIFSNIRPFLYLVKNNSIKEIQEKIEFIKRNKNDDRLRDGISLIEKECNFVTWSNKINNFIKSI